MSKHNVIFFTHPGDEHSCVPNNQHIKEWNTTDHRRKFLSADGEYIDGVGQHNVGTISFWGEWERESRFSTIDSYDADAPHYVHNPICKDDKVLLMLNDGNTDDVNDSFRKACKCFYNGNKQNTDPYVFGNHFMYSCCKQNKKGTKNSATKNLKPGDVIVFYSYKGTKASRNYECMIDTVFVVGGVLAQGNYSKMIPELSSNDYISKLYITTTILPICYGNIDELGGEDNNADYVLYYGVNYNERDKYNGMFSFFPCKITSDSPNGFHRFKHAPFYEKYPTQWFGKKILNDEEIMTFWETLKNEILAAGYLLGIKANEPI